MTVIDLILENHNECCTAEMQLSFLSHRDGQIRERERTSPNDAGNQGQNFTTLGNYAEIKN